MSYRRVLIAFTICCFVSDNSAGGDDVYTDLNGEKPNPTVDYSLGVDAYIDGDYRTAERYWVSAADAQHAKSMFNLGMLHHQRKIPNASQEIAENWLISAGEHGYAAADYIYATILLEREAPQSQVLNLLQRASDKGYYPAHPMLTKLKLSGQDQQTNLSMFGPAMPTAIKKERATIVDQAATTVLPIESAPKSMERPFAQITQTPDLSDDQMVEFEVFSVNESTSSADVESSNLESSELAAELEPLLEVGKIDRDDKIELEVAYDQVPTLDLVDVNREPNQQIPLAEPSMPQSFATNHYRDEKWINAQNPNYWTIQLTKFSNRAKLEKYIGDHGLKMLAAYFQENRDQNSFYYLLYGIYETKLEAQYGRNFLPPVLRKNRPQLRELRDVQKVIAAQE